MAEVVTLTKARARGIAVRAQLLTAPAPTDLLDVAHRLTAIQADPTAAVAPSAELVCWSRLGERYQPGDLDGALARGALIEFQGMIRPAADLDLFRAEMRQWRDPAELTGWQQSTAEWVELNDGCRRDILALLRTDGPLPAKAFPDTTEVPWRSSGWNDGRNVRMLLELMERRGDIAAAGRDGRERLWDLAERLHPDGEEVPPADALRIRAERRLAALGIARARTTQTPGEPNDVGEAGIPATVDGVRGRWRVDPAYLEPGPAEPRVVLLSPLDRLVYDRKRMAELWDFDYQLEMYKPAAARRWGYWAMPILSGDDLVGKLDATADPTAGRLFVDAVHTDFDWPDPLRDHVDREIDALAAFLGLHTERR